jgi:hypothetical protein
MRFTGDRVIQGYDLSVIESSNDTIYRCSNYTRIRLADVRDIQGYKFPLFEPSKDTIYQCSSYTRIRLNTIYMCSRYAWIRLAGVRAIQGYDLSIFEITRFIIYNKAYDRETCIKQHVLCIVYIIYCFNVDHKWCSCLLHFCVGVFIFRSHDAQNNVNANMFFPFDLMVLVARTT